MFLIASVAVCVCVLSYVTAVSAEIVQKIAIQGQTVTLPCHAEADIKVQWVDPKNMPISFDTTITNGRTDRFAIDSKYRNDRNLVISGVHSDDAGIYRCRYNKLDGTVVEKSVNLVINVMPTIVNSSAEQAVETGGNVSLECFAAGFPPPTVTWFRYVNTSERISLNAEGNTYAVQNVDRQAAGIYECFADNGVKPAVAAKMRVDVKFAPVVSVPYREISQHEGAATVLTCIIDANPIERIFWQRDGVPLEDNNKYRISAWATGEYQQMLGATVTDLVTSDFGTYECVAENQFGQDKGRIAIREFQSGKLRVVTAPKDTIAMTGSRTVLECSVIGMSAFDIVTWLYSSDDKTYQQLFISNAGDGESPLLENTEKYQIVDHYNLVIKSVSMEDAGSYVCTILGQKNYTAELSVLDHVACEDTVIVADDQENIRSGCSVSYTGLADAGWRIKWIRSDTGDRMPSMSDDSFGLSKRVLVLTADYPASNGDYVCTVASRQPFYADNCTVQLRVRPEKAGNSSASCNGIESKTKHDTSSQTVLFLSLVLTAVVICFILLIAFIVTYYRRELAVVRLSVPESVPLKKSNGTSSSSPVNV